MPILAQKSTISLVPTPNVVISDLLDGDVLSWNESQKIFKNTSIDNVVNLTSTTTGDSNLIKSIDGQEFVLRELVAGNNVTLSVNENGDIVINQDIQSIPIENASNIGGGVSLFSGKNGQNLEFNTLAGGSNLTINSNNNLLTLNVDAVTNIINVGSGFNVAIERENDNIKFKTIAAGNNIDIIDNNNTLTLNAITGFGPDSFITGRFEFRVDFDPSGNISNVNSLPTGWTSILTADGFELTHNLGKYPVSVTYYGYDLDTDSYRYRNPTAAYQVSFETPTKNNITNFKINASAAGTFANGHAYILLVF